MLDRSSFAALARSGGLKASREDSPTRERKERRQWRETEDVQKDEHRAHVAVVSGMPPLPYGMPVCCC